ncbi:MAG: DNA-(apurinic or apyrimidinic site) lyase [Frankiales bacterium]|nr:DNA-(apurinic or apyrimidinic site) lyase [Frankiales bacterium]
MSGARFAVTAARPSDAGRGAGRPGQRPHWVLSGTEEEEQVPEGDTVWLAGRRLHEALAGKELVLSDFRVPQLATVSLVGETVLEVASVGKHLLTRLSSGRSLHTHFRMDGTWHLYSPGSPWRGGPDHEVRVVLGVADRVAVGYRLPVVELVTDESSVVGHLGPDIVTEGFDPSEAVRRLAADPDREIGMALLDQRAVAGIGNLYRLEALFLRGVNPWAPVSSVDLEPLVQVARKLMRANLRHAQQSTTGSMRRGEEHWVFERPRKPCRRCGTRISVADQGEPPRARITYWCPRCQPSVAG